MFDLREKARHLSLRLRVHGTSTLQVRGLSMCGCTLAVENRVDAVAPESVAEDDE